MTRSDFPKQVRVGAFVFAVDSGPKATLELARDGDLGSTDFEMLSIKVRGDVAEELRWEILLHEILHAAWLQTPLAQLFTDEQGETVIRGLTPLLHPFVKRDDIG